MTNSGDYLCSNTLKCIDMTAPVTVEALHDLHAAHCSIRPADTVNACNSSTLGGQMGAAVPFQEQLSPGISCSVHHPPLLTTAVSSLLLYHPLLVRCCTVKTSQLPTFHIQKHPPPQHAHPQNSTESQLSPLATFKNRPSAPVFVQEHK